MNECILELAKQCGYWSGQTIEMNDVGIQRFAELIIRECILALDEADGSVHHSECLLEHFGVEE